MMITYTEIEHLIEKSGDVIREISPAMAKSSNGFMLDFWQRFLENNRALLVLLKGGFIGEAMAIQRLSIENFANMLALLLGKVTVGQLEDHARAALVTVMKEQQKMDKQDCSLTAENRERLNTFLDEAKQDEKNSGLSTYNLLGSCKLNFVYQARYRVLSVTAAHSSLTSVAGGKKALQDPAFAAATANEVLQTAKDLLQLAMKYAQEHARKSVA